MERVKQFVMQQKVTIALFAVAVALLLFSGVGTARAALTYFSEDYVTHVEMKDIGVSLLENGEAVAWRDYLGENNWNETDTELPDTLLYKQDRSATDYVYRGAQGMLLANLLPEGEQVKLGVPYKEELAVRNSGTIDQYTRVIITKSWLDERGDKRTDVSPSLIDLHLVNTDGAWILDEGSSTAERTVLYYSELLRSGETTPLFADKLTIDGKVALRVSQTEQKTDDGTVITTTYDFDGLTFCLEASVEAVQDHNAEDAAKSAWGVDLSISDGKLSLR